MKKVMTCIFCLAVASIASAAVEWSNVEEANYVSGRKCSSGYLQGKVVLVCRDASLAPRMEEVWTSFKTKSFVLIGSYGEASKGTSYPVYSSASLAGNAPASSLYVVDEFGQVRYMGNDERRATEIVVMQLTDMEAPKTEAQVKQFLDYEIENLPGRACVRYQDLKKSNPVIFKEYAPKMEALLKDPEVKKLTELVRFARLAKDPPVVNPKKERMVKTRLAGKIKDAIPKFASLKTSENPLVVQEAKNALADLAWAKAALN